jgi:protein ImuB
MYAAIHIPGAGPSASLALLEVARTFSPEVEVIDPGTVVFSIGGLRRLFGPPGLIASELARRAHERGLDGNIGIARNPDLAVLSARYRRGVHVIAPGAEADELGSIRLADFPLSDETQFVLGQWGVRTLAEFCALPEAGLVERLGADAAFLHRLARGEWQRPVRIERTSDRYEETVALDHPVDNLEPLLFLLARILNDFCARLDRQARAAAEVLLRFELDRAPAEERSLKLPVPSRDSKALLRLLRLQLEARAPAAAITSFTLKLEPVAPRHIQHGLYTPPAPEPEKLELTLAKIRGFVGPTEAGSPRLLDTHRPDAWEMAPAPVLDGPAEASRPAGFCQDEPTCDPSPRPGLLLQRESQTSKPVVLRQAFRYCRPPKPARVDVRQGVPARVRAAGIDGQVKQSAGPWIQSGGWWTSQPWSRTEWDVGLDNGGLYRIFLAAGWFVEGSYD